MKLRKAQHRYYIIYLLNGEYHKRPVEDIYEAHKEIVYLRKHEGVTVLGYHDPNDWSFNWIIPQADQVAHLDSVMELTVKLNKGYE